MFHVKQFVFVAIFFFFFTQSYTQYAKTVYVNRPEPIIKLLTDEEIITSISSQKNNHQLSLQEEELFYWMNFARKHPKLFYDSVIFVYIKTFPELGRVQKFINSLKNDLYYSKPLPLLTLNESLISLAKEHAEDVRMQNNPAMAHSSSSGETFRERIKKFGLNVCAAENLSYSSSSILMQLVLLYLDIGFPDFGHRKNLLNSTYVNIGLSVVALRDGQKFFVQDFSCASNTK